MRLSNQHECRFRTLPNGLRAYYRNGWRGPGVLLRDAAQEAVLRRQLRIIDALDLLAKVLLPAWMLAWWILLGTWWERAALAALSLAVGLLLLVLVCIGRRISNLLKGCPGVADRLKEDEETACRRAYATNSGFLRDTLHVWLMLVTAIWGLAHAASYQEGWWPELVLAIMAAVAALRLMQLWRDSRRTGRVA